MQDARLQTLVAEYHHRSSAVQSEFDTMLRLAGIGYTTAVAVATVISTTDITLPTIAYWLAPLTFALLYALAIQSFHRVIFSSYYLRDLEDQIATSADIKFFHFENAQARGLFSVKTGRPSVIITYVIIFVVAAALYFILGAFCYYQLETMSSAAQLAAFVGMTISLGIVMIAAIVPVMKGFRFPYTSWIRGPSVTAEYGPSRSEVFRFAFYGFMPRPLDLVLKSINILAASWFALVFTREPLTRRVVIAVLLTFLTIEVLLKQGTYIWNDILDIDNDRTHPYKARRALASAGRRVLGTAKVLFLARVILAVGLAFWLSLERHYWWLLSIVFILIVLQYAYDRLAKPLGGPWRLTVCALGHAERWVAAVLAVAWATGHFDWIVLTGLAGGGLTFSLVFLAGYWWSEADLFLRERSRKGGERGQNSAIDYWFLSCSPRYRRILSLLLFPISGLLVGRHLGLDFGGYVLLIGVGIVLGLGLIAAMEGLHKCVVSNDIRAILRTVFLIAVGGMVIFSWWKGIEHAAYIAALGIPALVLALYDYNPYEDLMLVKLAAGLRRLPTAVDSFLFERRRFDPAGVEAGGPVVDAARPSQRRIGKELVRVERSSLNEGNGL